MAGLQLWVQNELRREKVNDLASAITVEESLMDWKGSSDGADKNKNSKGMKKFSGKNDHEASTSKANVDNKVRRGSLGPWESTAGKKRETSFSVSIFPIANFSPFRI